MMKTPSSDEMRATFAKLNETHAKLFPDEPPLDLSPGQLVLMSALGVGVLLSYITYHAPRKGAVLIGRGVILLATSPLRTLRLARLGLRSVFAKRAASK